jgi:hypothetical protein
MPDRQLDVLLAGGSFFEGPRWRDGRWWVSDFYRHRVLAVDPMAAFACMLGGENGRTLLVCAAPDFLEHNRAGSRDAVLFTTTVEVPHAGLP